MGACCSDWNEGVLPWDFGLDLDSTRRSCRCAAVFSDRGVYKLGEEFT
jgi:hypothetical protein